MSYGAVVDVGDCTWLPAGMWLADAGAMRRLGFVLVVLYAGCLGNCFFESNDCPGHASSGCMGGGNCDCPLSDSLGSANGTHCGKPNLTCSDSLFSAPSCTSDSLTLSWQCTRPPDFSFARFDFSIPRPDLHVKVGCSDYRDCLVDCMASVQNANLATCTASCAPAASSAAVAAYDAAVQCAVDHCVGDTDASTGKCVRESDGDGGSTLFNEDGTPLSPTDTGTGMKRCNLCLHDAHASLQDQSCTHPGSADCDPTECAALVTACVLD